MRRVIPAILFAFLFIPNLALSQDKYSTARLKFDTRFDFTGKIPTHNSSSPLSSFDGKYLNILLEGEINDKFSYNYRQRLILDSKPNYQSFFNATDWLYLSYKISKNFTISGGKQVVAIGGYEYDYAPIDVYLWSTFWSKVTCFQIGGTVSYKTADDKHSVGFQVTNSPFSTQSLQGIYSYNLIWYGDLNAFSTIYSLNRIEVEKGYYINYIALGNKFSVNNFSVEVDLMDRFFDHQSNLLEDYTVIGNFKYAVKDKLNLFIKAGYDQNKAQQPTATFIYDRYVLPGTEHLFYGAGIEFYPIKDSDNVRIHALWTSNNDILQYHTFNIGVRWQMDVYKK